MNLPPRLPPAGNRTFVRRLQELLATGVYCFYLALAAGNSPRLPDRISVMRDGTIALSGKNQRTVHRRHYSGHHASATGKIASRQPKIMAGITRQPPSNMPPERRCADTGKSDRRRFQECQPDAQCRRNSGPGWAGGSRTHRTGRDALWSACTLRGGRIMLNGKEINRLSIGERLLRGLVYSAGRSPVIRLISMLHWRGTSAPSLITFVDSRAKNRAKDNATLERYRRALNIKFNQPEQAARTLSGGNQQKILIANARAAASG